MSEDVDTSVLLQRRITELTQKVPVDNEDARKRAELFITLMHQSLAHAHMARAFNEQDQSEVFFDLAEEAGREAFNADSVHVARFTEDARPYKLALGSILSAGKGKKVQGVGDGRFVNLGLVEVLCRIQEIDPDEMRELYRKWQEGEHDAARTR